MMTQSSPRTASLALVVGVVAISFAAIFFRLAAPTHPLAMASFRLLLAAAFLSIFVVRASRRGGLDRRFVGRAVVGGVFYALHFGTWVWSLELTTVAASVTLVTATPLLLACVAVVTGVDRPDRHLWVALLVAAAGVAVIGGTDWGMSPSALLGDALALLGAAAMAAYMLVVRPMGFIDVLAFTGIATLVGGLILAGVGLALGVPPLPASDAAFGALLLAALIPQLIGHNALTWALRHLRPTTVGIATLGEPVGATILAWLILTEVPAISTLTGCALTLTGVALSLLRPNQSRRST